MQTQESSSLLPAGIGQGKAISTVKRLRTSCTKRSAWCGKGVTQHSVPKRKKTQPEPTFQNTLRFIVLFLSSSHKYPGLDASRVSTSISWSGTGARLVHIIMTIFVFYFFGYAISVDWKTNPRESLRKGCKQLLVG